MMADLVRQGEGDAFDPDVTMAAQAAIQSNRAPLLANIGLRVHEARFPIHIEIDIGKAGSEPLEQSLRSMQRPARLDRPDELRRNDIVENRRLAPPPREPARSAARAQETMTLITQNCCGAIAFYAPKRSTACKDERTLASLSELRERRFAALAQRLDTLGACNAASAFETGTRLSPLAAHFP
jgi:hypothetical protein